MAPDPKKKQPAPATSFDQQPQGVASGAGSSAAQPRPKTSDELDQAPPPRPPVDWSKLRPQQAQADSSTQLGEHAPGDRGMPTGPFAMQTGPAFSSDQEAQQPTTPHLVGYGQPPDETEVNWNNNVRVLPVDTFQMRDVMPEAVAPVPPNADLNKVDYGIDPFTMRDRRARWGAYHAVATQVDQTQRAVFPYTEQFHDASKNPALKALGFIVEKPGNMASSAEDQQLPTRGGVKMGSLFAGDTLSLGKQDQHAISSAANAAKQGHGGADGAFLGTTQADEALNSATNKLSAAKDAVDEQRHAFAAVTQDIEANNASDEAADAREEIESLKEHAESVKTSMEFLAALPKIVALDPEGLATVASTYAYAASKYRIADVQTRLDKATKVMKTARAKALQERLEAARKATSEKWHLFGAAMSDVEVALTARRQAYNQAATTVADSASGDHGSKARLAGIIAAIPIVESLIGSIKTVVSASSFNVEYSREAGFGYGIAIHHGLPQAYNLPVVLGQLFSVNQFYISLLLTWKGRLASLIAVKDQIAGPRPQAD